MDLNVPYAFILRANTHKHSRLKKEDVHVVRAATYNDFSALLYYKFIRIDDSTIL